MKKILLLSSLMLAFVFANSQYLTRYPTTGKDSVIDATTKTITFPSTLNNLQAIGLTLDNSTGTTAGVAYLYVRLDTTNGANEWVRPGGADSLIMADNATKIWNLTAAGYGHYFNGFKIYFVPTGTQKTYFWIRQLRR